MICAWSAQATKVCTATIKLVRDADVSQANSVYSSQYNLTFCPIKKRYVVILIKSAPQQRNNSGITRKKVIFFRVIPPTLVVL